MNTAARRWFREPMVWLLVALPAASVVATVVLLRVGGAGATFDVAPEPVQRSAQVQQRDLAADHRAAELGLATTARVGVATFPGPAFLIDGDALPPGDYRLELVHPIDGSADRDVRLRHDGEREVAVAGFDPGIAWRVRLGPADGEWRIVGRWNPQRPDAPIALRPALGDGTAP